MKRCFLSLHKFSEWRSLGSTSCEMKRTCKRCGKEQIRKFAEHEWTDALPNNPCNLTRDCKNCGYRDYRELPHEYGPDIFPDNRCNSRKTCIKCGHFVTARKHVGEWKLIRKERIADRINVIYADVSTYQCTVCGETRRESAK